MKTYRISKARLDEQRRALLRARRMVWVLLIANVGCAFFVVDFHRLLSDRRITLLTVLALGVGGFLGLFEFLREAQVRIEETLPSFELALDTGHLTRRQVNVPEVTINYAEIRQIEEYAGKWLKIRGDPGLPSITVPSNVENYRQLKADLVSLSGVAITAKRQGPVLAKVGLVMIPTFAFLVISFLATNRLIAAIASFTLAVMMFKAKMFEHRRPGAAREAKSVFVWSTSTAIVFVIRGMYLLMF